MTFAARSSWSSASPAPPLPGVIPFPITFIDTRLTGNPAGTSFPITFIDTRFTADAAGIAFPITLSR